MTLQEFCGLVKEGVGPRFTMIAQINDHIEDKVMVSLYNGYSN